MINPAEFLRTPLVIQQYLRSRNLLTLTALAIFYIFNLKKQIFYHLLSDK